MRPTRTNVDDLSLSTYLPSAAATSNPPQREVEHALLISLQRIVGLSSKRAYHCRWTNVHNGRDVSLEHPAGYGGEQVVRVTARASGRAAEIGRRLPDAIARSRPSLCENEKVPGFRVSLYPSRVAARPIRRDLKSRFSKTPHSACVFTQPRPTTVIESGTASTAAIEVQRP